MTIAKNYAGAWIISDVINGRLMTRQYYFYTKKEALAEFRAEIKEMRG